MDRHPTARHEIAGNLAVILFGALFLTYTVRYPLDSWENPGPAVFPLILGAVLTTLGVIELVGAIRKSRQKGIEGKREDDGQPEGEAALRGGKAGKPLRMISLTILYLLLIPWIGFFVSTFLFAALASRITEAKGWVRPMALAAGIALSCYLLFEAWLKLSFPRGILF